MLARVSPRYGVGCEKLEGAWDATCIVHRRGRGRAFLLLCRWWCAWVSEAREIYPGGGVARRRGGPSCGGEAGDHADIGGAVCAFDGGRVSDLGRHRVVFLRNEG